MDCFMDVIYIYLLSSMHRPETLHKFIASFACARIGARAVVSRQTCDESSRSSSQQQSLPSTHSIKPNKQIQTKSL